MSTIKYEIYRAALNALATLHGPDIRDHVEMEKIESLDTPDKWKVEWASMVAAKNYKYNVYHVLSFWYAVQQSPMTRHDKLTTELNAMMPNWSGFPSKRVMIICFIRRIRSDPWQLPLLILGKTRRLFSWLVAIVIDHP